jgi:hypothetical protein
MFVLLSYEGNTIEIMVDDESMKRSNGEQIVADETFDVTHGQSIGFFRRCSRKVSKQKDYCCYLSMLDIPMLLLNIQT